MRAHCPAGVHTVPRHRGLRRSVRCGRPHRVAGQRDGRSIGTLTVFGPLAPGREQAGEAFARIGLASAGGVWLVGGGVLLVLALRRALSTGARSRGRSSLGRVARAEGAGAGARDLQDEVATIAREFNRMLDRISDDERRRQQLLSAISHELRTPLAVARGHLELLPDARGRSRSIRRPTPPRWRLQRARPPVRPHRRRPVRDQSRRQRRLRRPANPYSPPMCWRALQQRDHRLEKPTRCRVDPAPPVVLVGDEYRLTQALLNLVVNARTHTHPGYARSRSTP